MKTEYGKKVVGVPTAFYNFKKLVFR